MKLERKREEELAQRQGNTGRTVIMVIWLGIAGFASYYIANIIFTGGTLTYDQARDAMVFPIIGLTAPRVNAIPDLLIQGSCILLILIFMQTILFVGFALGNPAARRKSGQANAYSKYKREFGDQ